MYAIRSYYVKSADIAPCGINCSLCSGFLRKKNPCPGCNGPGGKPAYCTDCKIRLCPEKASERELCGTCAQYPCARMKSLRKRYALKYGVVITSYSIHYTKLYESLIRS